MNTPRPNEIYRHFKGNLYRVIAIAQDADSGDRVVVYQALYGEYGLFTRKLTAFVERLDTHKYPYADQIHRFELFQNPCAPSVNPVEVPGRAASPAGQSAYAPSDPMEVPGRAASPAGRSAYAPSGTMEPPRRGIKSGGPLSGSSDSKPAVETGRSSYPGDEAYDKPIISERIYFDDDLDDFEEGSEMCERQDFPDRREDIPAGRAEGDAEAPDLDPLLLEFLDNPGHQERLDILERMRPKLTENMVNIMAVALETELQTPASDTDAAYAELRAYLLTMDKYERKHRNYFKGIF